MESLYTKYRPQTFADVVGQGHVVATLERAVLEGRTGHAYLFCGPRGTGKTTMARLLAKALLCEQGPGHLPDGSCEQCQLVAAGEHPDVYELDAASNTGVDNVREEIISRVDYAPVLGSRKIYIIDEVHMLTTAAFNALLKTLEEPPSHVVFVLCTTDPQKILETILSRVQRFDFHAISNDDVLARLRYVCEQEGFVYEPRALDLIVRHAQGGMRDALTKLEQLATGGSGTISLEAAQELLGEVAASRLADVSMALARRDVSELFAAVAEFASAGRDLLQVMAELAARLRDVYVVAAVGARPGIVTAPEAELGRLTEEAQAWGAPDRLSRALAVLSEASSEMRLATNQRLVLELAFTRLARPEGDVTLDALAERVAVLERRVAELEAGAASGRPTVVSEAPAVSAQAAAPTPVALATQADSQSQARRESVKQAQLSPMAPQRVAATQPAVPQTPPQPEPAKQQAPRMPERQQAPAQAQRPQQRQTPASHAPAPQSQPQPQPAPVPAAAPQAEQPATPAIVDQGEQQRRWKLVCDDLLATAPARGSLLLQSSIASDDGNSLLVNLPKGSGFAVRMLDRADVRALIDPIVTRHFGRRKLVFAEGSSTAPYLSQREAPAAVSSVVTAPAPQPAPAPAPQPAPAPTPQPAPAPVAPAAVQPQAPATPNYPMPWDPAPEPAPAEASPAAYDEVVPYDDADAFGDYQGEEDLPPLDIPGQPMTAEQARTMPQPPQPAPVLQPAPAPQPAPATPTPEPKPEPASQPAVDVTQASEPATSAPAQEDPAKKKPQSEEEAQLMALLTEVFGEGVTIK